MQSFITYRYVLKPGKSRGDYMNWLNINWSELQKLGATSYQLWNSTQDGERVLFCKYTINNIRHWVRQSSRPVMKDIIDPLADCVDIERSSLKITVIADTLDHSDYSFYS